MFSHVSPLSTASQATHAKTGDTRTQRRRALGFQERSCVVLGASVISYSPCLAGNIQMDRAARSPSESRERAVSSEPCSTRPNPFDDDDGSSARKRRRTSLNGASPSRSVETPQDSPHADVQDSPAGKDASMTVDSASSPPLTPERQQGEDVPQAASDTKPQKITLNLKSRKLLPCSEPSSPTSQNGVDIGPAGVQENGIRASVEDSDLDVSHASPDLNETALSELDMDHPPIEIIDSDYEDDGVAHVTIFQEANPMVSFPYQPNDPLVDSMPKLCQLLPHSKLPHMCCIPIHMLTGYVADHQAMGLLQVWIEEYLTWVSFRDFASQHDLYLEYREFWQMLPQYVWQYSSPNRSVSPLLLKAFIMAKSSSQDCTRTESTASSFALRVSHFFCTIDCILCRTRPRVSPRLA